MNIFGNLRRLESRLANTVDGAAQRVAPSHPHDPLETLHLIVECSQRVPIYDDRSAYGTNILRTGKTITVPSGVPTASGCK
jgi:hypothetical protein